MSGIITKSIQVFRDWFSIGTGIGWGCGFQCRGCTGIHYWAVVFNLGTEVNNVGAEIFNVGLWYSLLGLWFLMQGLVQHRDCGIQSRN